MQQFLVKFSGTYFFVGRNKQGLPMGSPFPSIGLRMSYLTGCQVQERLQRMGHSDAIVCTLAGAGALPEDIEASSADEEELQFVWGSDSPETETVQPKSRKRSKSRWQ